MIRLPAIIWEVSSVASPSPPVAETWLLVPEHAPVFSSGIGEQRAGVVLGVDVKSLLPRQSRAVEQRLEDLALRRCEAVLIRGASPEDIKSGGPLHRLLRLRERSLFDLLFIDAEDHGTAEWMVHHTPAHAVCLPFGLEDQTARYRLLHDAKEMNVALIARRPAKAVWHSGFTINALTELSFTAGESGIASVVHPLPASESELERVMDAIAHPMAEGDRDLWWQRFSQAVPPPPPMPRGVPVD